MKRRFFALMCGLVVTASLLAACGSTTAPVEQKPVQETEQKEVQEDLATETVEAEEPVQIEYDALQNLFISLTFDTKPEELEAMIQEYGLCSASQEFNSDDGTIDYVIAYTEGAAKFKHADSGDYIKISFEKNDDNAFRYANYSSSSHSNGMGLLYHHGTWFDFRTANAEDYSGYYFTTGSGGKKQGIVVKYTNGNEVQTGYYVCDSAQEVLAEVLK